MKCGRIGLLFCCIFVLRATGGAYGAVITATAFDSAYDTSVAAAGGAEYDFASVTVFVDPAQTNWIAWNDAPTVSYTHPARPGEFFFGPGGIGVDDFIRLTVVRQQTGQSLTVDIDQNDGFAVSSGTQNLIFGDAATAPDAARDPGGFPGPPQFLDDAASHNAIFAAPGMYEFHFSFRNVYGSSAAHPEMWLLVSTVPEPTAVLTSTLLPLLLIRRCHGSSRTRS